MKQLYTNILDGAVAQLARAPALQAGGQEFDSPQLHHIDNSKTKVIFGLELSWIVDYKRVVQGKWGIIHEIVLNVHRIN